MKQRTSRFSLVVILTLVVSLLNTAICSGDSGSWQTELVDAANDVGLGSKLAIDSNGYPHIAYQDRTNYDLKYAYYDGSTWHIEIVHSADSTGHSPALALDSNDNPHIAWTYYTPSYSLMYAYRDSGGWHIQNVKPGSWPGHISLVIDSGDHPHITYFTDIDGGDTSDSVMYIWHDGTSWHTYNVEKSIANANTGILSSLKLDSLDRPHIAYSSGFDRHVKYAWYDGSTWHYETVYDDGQMWGYVSLAFDSAGAPYILHLDLSRDMVLDYFWKDGGSWQRETIGSGFSREGIGLAFAPLDVPHIAYATEDGTDYYVQHAFKTGGAWQSETVALGRTGSLVIDAAGKAYMSYYDIVGQDLRYASRETSLIVVPDVDEVYPGDMLDVDLNIESADNLYAAQALCVVDPAVLEPQSAAFGDFFDPVNRLIAANEISPTVGTWLGAISQQNPAGPLSGDGWYATLTFEATGVGTMTVTCDPLFSDRDGFTQTVFSIGAEVTVLPYATISGTATYQGRLDHAGITVDATGPVSQTDTTDSNGGFVLGQLRTGTYTITADADSYLPNCTSVALTAGDEVTLSSTRLLGGDLNDDEMINIGDATLLTANFNESVPPADARADINADNMVNIQDLAILGGNYEVSGCQGW